MDLERNEDTMIGSEFFKKPFNTKEFTNSREMIEIATCLSSKEKIYLKLRLNAE